MRLADQLASAVNTVNDVNLCGAISSLSAGITRVECFELSDDVRDACEAVSRSKPSSILSALSLTRLPYAQTWIEWVRGHNPGSGPSHKPLSTRVGCLLEAHDASLQTGL